MKKLLLTTLAAVLGLMLKAQNSGYTYWFDTDAKPIQYEILSAKSTELELDASSLESGTHTLHFQVSDSNGQQSTIHTIPFARTLSLQNARAYIYIDGEPTTSVSLSEKPTTDFEIDASQISHGLHTLAIQAISSDGAASSMHEAVFMRVPNNNELREMRCYYTIDNDTTMRIDGRFQGSNILLADIDVSTLEDGLHSINFILASDAGLTTRQYNSWFIKLPLGGVNISSYEYWINEDRHNRKHVNVDKASNPYTLAALLPLDSQPFRSKSYYFEVENGQPYVYPRNDFNILFTDNRGYFTIKSQSYHDAAGRTALEDIPLFDTASKTVKDLADNNIQWYKFESINGDSLAIKADYACMIEVYSPSGEKFLSASGAESVRGFGAHTMQSGTHYIAIHDISNTSRTVNVSIEHIDKFALLKLTPTKLAAKNFVIFDMYGNGFESLKDVILEDKMGNAYPIRPPHIYDWSYATAAAIFTDNPIPCGHYTLRLKFEDENGAISELSREIAIEEPTKVKVAVGFDPHNTSTAINRTLSVTVTNESNVPLWGIPLCIARTSRYPDMGYNFRLLVASKDGQICDSVYFDTDNLLGMGISGRYIPIIIPYLNPKESKVYDFSITHIDGNNFDFYAWCETPWCIEADEIFGSEAKAHINSPTKASRGFDFSGYESLKDFLNIASHVPNQAISNAASLTGYALDVADTKVNQINQGQTRQIQSYVENGYGWALEDMPQYPRSDGTTPQAYLLHDSGEGDDGGATNQWSQSCAENGGRNPRPHNVDFPQSVDPNDMIGYTSQSGSKYIGKTIKTLSYTIEFENDPEFATASAQTVKIDNKLNGNIYDLSSFSPRTLRIGNRTITFDKNKKNQVITEDMRPEICGIAQATVSYDESNGEICLLIESLSPYTMEKTDDFMAGFLPVNDENGSGIGEFCYDIDLRTGISDGTAVDNQATIVFDNNEAITTPIWHNTTDYISPISNIAEVKTSDNFTYNIKIEGDDDKSDIWKYDLYLRTGDKLSWTKIMSDLYDEVVIFISDTELENAEFMSVAYDRAGNEEENEITAGIPGDVDGNGKIDANDLVIVNNYYVGRQVDIRKSAADVNADGKIDSQDNVGIRHLYVGNAARSSRTRKYSNK